MTPKRRTKRNLFGFGGKTRAHEVPVTGKCGKRSSMTISEAMGAAYKAGQRSGDTGLFGQWSCDVGLNCRSSGLLRRLRTEYHRGVEGAPSTAQKAEEKRQAPKSAGSFKGVRITKVGDEFETSLERGTRFDTLQDAKNFIMAWKKRANPEGRIDYELPGSSNTFIMPSSRRRGMYDVIVGGVQRYTKPTLKGAEGAMKKLGAKKRGNPKTKTVSIKFASPKNATTKRAKPARKNPLGVKVSTLTQGKAKASIYYQPPKKYVTVIEADGRKAEYKLSSFAAAQQAARLKLADVARNPKSAIDDLADTGLDLVPGGGIAKKLASKAFSTRPSGKKRRRNPEAAAAKLYEEFHGFPSEEVVEYVESEHRHSVTVALGVLIHLDIITAENKKVRLEAPNPDNGVKFDKIVQVTMSEDGRQLYLVGGDQKIDTAKLGLGKEDVRDQMFIGTITQIMYRTVKTFEAKGQEPVDFFHDFGKEGSRGICPVLLYNPRDERMKVYGGRYQIAKPEGWLKGVSPGIIG